MCAASKLSRAEQRRVRELADWTTRWHQGDEPILADLLPELVTLHGAHAAMATRMRRGEGRWVADFVHSTGVPHHYPELFDELTEAAPYNFTAYNPARPEPQQRNNPMILDDIMPRHEWEQSFTYQRAMKPLGFASMDQIRVLICDGPELLAWVGTLRDVPFGDRDRELFGALVPALRERLKWEARLSRGELAKAALVEALGAILAPALIVRGDGRVAHANTAGRAWLQELKIIKLPPDAPRTLAACDVTQLIGRGLPPHWLIVYRGTVNGRRERVRRRAIDWRLTPRERQVLDLVVQGDTNSSMATKLGCRRRTVDSHVSAVLRKASSSNRVELTQVFWSERA